MRVVCAPNAFKGSITAGDAAAAMARGVVEAGALATVVPVADGGDGTLDVLLASDPGSRVITVHASGPLGDPAVARLGILNLGRARDATAVVEMAEASGLRLLRPDRLDPLHATSRGTGGMIRVALGQRVTRIIVAVGGSASSDGGAGALQALGVRLLDAEGRDIGPGGAALRALESIDMSGLDPRLQGVRMEVAVDVRTPLLGEEGAARVFGPQKGASPDDIAVLEAGLTRLAAIAERDCGAAGLAAARGAGAAGGLAFGLGLLGATLVAGAPLVCDLVHLDRAIAGAGLVLTGEGRLDAQTAMGKAPSEVARRAAAAGVPCVAIAGTVEARLPELFSDAVALDHLAPTTAGRDIAAALLVRAAAHVVRSYGVGSRAGINL
ncbi:MAG TPA: glycerate kinase [Candidatus Dormibacteraeota bacterium]